MQDDAAADSRAPGRDLFKEEAVRRTVIINEDLLRIPPLEMVFQSFPQLVPQERPLGDLMEILPAVKFKDVYKRQNRTLHIHIGLIAHFPV